MTPSDSAVRDASRVLRLGWAAKGLLWVVVAWLAASMALDGYTTEDADQAGALATLADGPVGRILVAVVSIGLAFHVIWLGWSAAFADDDDDPLRPVKRVGWAGLTLSYIVLAATGLEIAWRGPTLGAGDDGGATSPTGLAQRVMGLPGGRPIVAIIGLGIIAVGLYQLWSAVGGDPLDELDVSGVDPRRRKLLALTGRAGAMARAALMGIAGSLFLEAARRYDPDQAGGLDQSLRALVSSPIGRPMLWAVAAGLLAAGLFDLLTHRLRHLED